MATDVLILGGIFFDDWSTPENMPFGGKQAMAVHKLPGGARVVDTLGPDEMDITFSGTLWGEAAYGDGQSLNDMRQSGEVVTLSFAGLSYEVIVMDCTVTLKRFPLYATYTVICQVVENAMAGGLDGIVSTFGDLVGADLATAFSVAGL